MAPAAPAVILFALQLIAQRAKNAENAQSQLGEVKIEEVIDARIMRKLDESGFIDRAYAVQGVSLK